jgi:hypothetical protein
MPRAGETIYYTYTIHILYIYYTYTIHILYIYAPHSTFIAPLYPITVIQNTFSKG